MKKNILPWEIKIAASLMFAQLVIALNGISSPSYILLGIFFLKGMSASLVILGLFSVIAILIYGIIRRNRMAFGVSRVFFTLLGVNFLANLIASSVLAEDYSGFLSGGAGTDVLSGYRLLSFSGLTLSVIIVMLLQKSRREFRN